MSEFLRRVKRLKKVITARREPSNMVTLIYDDDSERTMDGMDAFFEVMTANVVDVRYHSDEFADGFFEALIAGEHDLRALWANGDDSNMLCAVDSEE